jgi:rRNA maturation endonuclease Nob1
MEPSLGQATSEESFKCWNCGLMYATEGRAEARCPSCGQTCTREKCMVSQSSNEDY